MNKIQRAFLTTISLLVTMGVLADSYSITIDNADTGKGTISLASGEVTTSGTSASGATVTLYASPTGSYYLKEIVIEYVMDLGQAESPKLSNRAPIYLDLGQKIIINKETAASQFATNKANRYGGEYTFQMPTSNVVITATFLSATSFTANGNITLEISGSGTYTGIERQLVVTNTLPDPDVTLVEGTDFSISLQKINVGSGFEDVAEIKNAGTYQFTIQGLGAYSGEKTVNTLTIGKADLSIAPKDKSRQYHDANPTYSNTSSGSTGDFTYTGLVNDETNEVLTNQPSASIDANINNDVGYYTVTASGATAANYTIIHLTGTLTITPRNVNNTTTQATATLSDNTYTFYAEQYYRYDNIAHQPSVTVIDPSDGNKVLTKGTDYDVTYSVVEYGSADWKDVGMYQATITFTNNYTGDNIIKPYQIRKEVTLNNSSNYQWRTFYDPKYNMEVMDGFQAFSVDNINTNAVLLDNRTVIKSGMPMLLFKTGATYAGFYPPLIASDDGRLTGWSSIAQYKCKVDNEGNPINWILDSDGGITGGTTKIWILVDDKFARSKSGTLEAGKCYLDLSGTAYYAPMFNLGITPTGIDEIKVEDTRKGNQFYDLSGRKISHPTKGLYIQNGKKIIIK